MSSFLVQLPAVLPVLEREAKDTLAVVCGGHHRIWEVLEPHSGLTADGTPSALSVIHCVRDFIHKLWFNSRKCHAPTVEVTTPNRIQSGCPASDEGPEVL